MPGEKTVLNFAVAVDASADVPLLAWFDLDDEWLPKARQIHDGLAKSAARCRDPAARLGAAPAPTC